MGTSTQRKLLACLLAVGFSATSTTAFVPSTRTTKIATNLQVIPSPAELGDLSNVGHAAQDILTSTSALLSDAAAATADAAASDDGGWWRSYLQIFRNILVFEHDLIDGPLKSAGVESTWGISIALFTCSKSQYLPYVCIFEVP